MYALSCFKVFIFSSLLFIALDNNVSLAEPQLHIGTPSKQTNVVSKASAFADKSNNTQTILPPPVPSNVAEVNTCNNNPLPSVSDGKITATKFDKWADFIGLMTGVIALLSVIATLLSLMWFIGSHIDNTKTRELLKDQLKEAEKFKKDAHERFENLVKINKEILDRQVEQQNIKISFAQKFVESYKSSSDQDGFRKKEPLDVLFSHQRQIIKLEKDLLNLESRDSRKVIESLRNIAQYDVIIEELRNYLLLIDDQKIFDQQHFDSSDHRKISDQFKQVVNDLAEKLETKK